MAPATSSMRGAPERSASASPVSARTERGTGPCGRSVRSSVVTALRPGSSSTAPSSIGSAAASSLSPVVSKSTTATGPCASSQGASALSSRPSSAYACSRAPNDPWSGDGPSIRARKRSRHGGRRTTSLGCASLRDLRTSDVDSTLVVAVLPNDDVHQRGLAGRGGALERGPELLRALDELAVAAERLHHLVVARVVEEGAVEHFVDG